MLQWLPRFSFVAMAISVMVALVIWAACVSVLIFRHDTTEAATVESRAAPMTKQEREEETKRDLEFRLRCQPTEYKDSLGVTHLKYAHPDCGGRVLN